MNADKTLISVVMPVYNAESTLIRAMDSILEQTYSNFELLCIYDDSDDASIDILEEYEKSDSRVRILRHGSKNGVAAALNYGIEKARGEYIARMDADDFSYPTRLQKQIEFLHKHEKIAVLGSSIRQITKRDSSIIDYPKTEQAILAMVPFWGPIMHPAVMFRKGYFINTLKEYNTKSIAEDYELWLRNMPQLAERMTNLEDVLLDHYVDNYHASLDNTSIIDTIDLRRKYIHRILGITTEKYTDMTIYQGVFMEDFSVRKSQIVNMFEFLCDIEHMNKIIGYCSQKELSIMETKLWNGALWMYLTVDNGKDIEKLLIPEKKIRADVCFLEVLKKQYNVSSREDITQLLEDMVRQRIEKASKVKKCIIYGIGSVCKKYLKIIPKDRIICLVDSDRRKWGQRILGKTVESPKALYTNDYDSVVVGTTNYYMELKRILHEGYGIDNNKIVSIQLLKYM